MLAKSNSKDRELREFLEKHSLIEYLEAFQKEKISYPDLEFLESDDVEGIFTKKFHQKRFLKCVETLRTSKSVKKEEASCVKNEGEKESKSKKKEEVVHMHVKCRHMDEKIYDIPLNISNEELIGKLLQEFLECEVKLQGEKITLVKKLKSFTIRDWKKKHEVSDGKMLRAVLCVDGAVLEAGGSEGKEKLEKLESENKQLRMEKRELEKSLKQSQEEAAAKAMEVKKMKCAMEKVVRESMAKSKKLEETVVAAKKKEINSSAVAVPRGFKSFRGILVPQNVVFEVNEKYRSKLEKVFSNGNKVVKGIGGMFNEFCFKTSAMFTAGKKFYFQVSAKVGNGDDMGFGFMSGEVTKKNVGYHEKGWSYHCYPVGDPKRTYHSNQKSSGYGPERTEGKHKFGIFCDFTNGKGEVSFIVDGKNWGVAYENVVPPVSPAFYIWSERDWFKIEDTFVLPDCI